MVYTNFFLQIQFLLTPYWHIPTQIIGSSLIHLMSSSPVRLQAFTRNDFKKTLPKHSLGNEPNKALSVWEGEHANNKETDGLPALIPPSSIFCIVFVMQYVYHAIWCMYQYFII